MRRLILMRAMKNGFSEETGNYDWEDGGAAPGHCRPA
jgi:hypothetical protein